MSKDNQRRPILYNGQTYAKPVTKSSGGGPKEMKFSYEEARDFVLSDVAKVKDNLRNMPSSQRLPNEVVVGLVMQPEFSAKSYYPDSLFDLGAEKFGLKEIGSRIYKNESSNKEQHNTLSSKMFFVRATEESLTKFENQLNKNAFSLTKSFQDDIRKISSINILEGSNQILGFPSEWENGKIEAVLHPFDVDKQRAINHFIDKITNAGVNRDYIKYKTYSSGITFVSFDANRDILQIVNGYNPLRTVHPLKMREFSALYRGTTIDNGPQAPLFKTKSPIYSISPITAKIGMKEGLDGGETFEVLELTYNAKTGLTSYKSLGKIKADANLVWDNRYNADEKTAQYLDKNGAPLASGIEGTKFSDSEKVQIGMLIKQIR